MNELGISASETEFSREYRGWTFIDTLTMDEHRLQMNIGVAFIWFPERTVLPNYFGGINSFGDLLANLIPCDAVGDIAARNLPDVPFVDERRIVRDACRAGLRAAGQRLASEVADRLSIDTFSPAASANYETKTTIRPSTSCRKASGLDSFRAHLLRRAAKPSWAFVNKRRFKRI